MTTRRCSASPSSGERPAVGSDTTSDSPGCPGVSLSGKTVTFQCPAADVGGLVIGYKALRERFDAFTMPEAVPEDATWEVFVDGAPVTFARDGLTVTLPDVTLADTAVVTLKATYVFPSEAKDLD